MVLAANNKKNDADTMEWPTVEYPRPDNCVLVKLEPNTAGVKLIVKWNSPEDVTTYKKLLAKDYDVTSILLRARVVTVNPLNVSELSSNRLAPVPVFAHIAL